LGKNSLRTVAEGRDPMLAPWACQEMENANLGDRRLDRRLTRLLSALGQRPTASIPAACGGHSEMAAAYRFFDNDKVTWQRILQPHYDCSRQIGRASCRERG